MPEVLRVENLRVAYSMGRMTIHAVNGVNFAVQSGETVGLVGESGCGKTTVARCIVRLMDPTRGKVYFNGIEITALPERKLRPLRQNLQMVFQDAATSLNPRMTVHQTLMEPLQLFGIASRAQRKERVREVLSLMSLDESHLARYPHQLSGGQQQRVAIARAVITDPLFIVLDEPTASQDAAVKVQLIALLHDLQQKLGLAYTYISHDLSTVRSLCHRILIMYLGKVVEEGPVDEIFDHPLHPYTRALISAIPIPDPKAKREKIRLKGETPSLIDIPTGCSLQDRCPFVIPICREQDPHLRNVSDEHYLACFNFNESDHSVLWGDER